MHLSQKIRRVEDALLVTLFVSAISVPVLGLMLHWDAAAESAENRQLAMRPAFPRSIGAVVAFPEKFTAYFNDHFGFRPTLIRWQGLTRLRLFGSSSPQVIVGKDGWLFYASEYSADGKRLVPSFTLEQLQTWKRVLEARRNWLARRGIQYLFVLCPNKETVYPEFLPRSFQPADQSRLDQLVNYLRKNSDLPILDLRPNLRAEKTGHVLFYKTDSHWNHFGGLAGYQAIVNELHKSFPQLQPVSESECEAFAYRRPGNLLLMLGLSSYLPEDSSVLGLRQPAFKKLQDEQINMIEKPVMAAVAERRERELPRLVMFHDSAALFMLQFLPQHFSRSVFVFLPKLDPVLIESEHPNIVVEEVAEMWLMNDWMADDAEIKLLESDGKGVVPTKVNANFSVYPP